MRLGARKRFLQQGCSKLPDLTFRRELEHMPLLQTLSVLVLPALAIAAALSDATSYTISNRLTAATALAFIPAALLSGLPLPVVGLSVLVGFGALVAGIAMFAAGWIGGGDAKLFAACALWMGTAAIAPFLTWTAVSGGALALLLLQLRRQPTLAALPGPAWAMRLIRPGENVPYGVAIAVGALAGFPVSALVKAL